MTGMLGDNEHERQRARKMILAGITILLAGAFMFTQSRGIPMLPSCVMTVGATLLLVGILGYFG